MKKILALSLAFAAFTMNVSAQENTKASSDKSIKHERKHGGHKKDMMKDMNLTDAQKSQMKAIKEDKTLSKEDRKAKMSAVFTPEQRTKMTENRANMQAKRKEMQEKKSKKMQEKLGLTKDQSDRLKSQNDATHAQLKALKEDKTLSKEAKKEKMKAIKASAHEQRKSVLSADQLKRWKR